MLRGMLTRSLAMVGVLGGVLLAQQSISDQLKTLRQLPDNTRARVTKQLALDIRALTTRERAGLAAELADLATEGDFGRDTLQEVTTTLDLALQETPGNAQSYVQLAQLARYEHMKVGMSHPQY